MYPALLATVANIAPHIKSLSGAASSKLVQLFASMSAPSFLLANETNHTLLTSLLESMNAIIEHQYSDNVHFVYAILRSSKRFEALRNFTLESGQEEIDRQSRLKKDRGEVTLTDTPKVSLDNNSERPLRPTEPEEPMDPSAFAIGDEDEEDSEAGSDTEKGGKPVKKETLPQPTVSPIETVSSPTRQSVSSPVEDAVPHQLRGMSEKARGKMPQRQNSTSSITDRNDGAGVSSPTGAAFTPTAAWVITPSSLPKL